MRQGFLDIMEAYKEEVTFLFYQENSGVRDQVFNYFFSEYRTDVEQKLATFQSKYGKILERQDTVLKEVRRGRQWGRGVKEKMREKSKNRQTGRGCSHEGEREEEGKLNHNIIEGEEDTLS